MSVSMWTDCPRRMRRGRKKARFAPSVNFGVEHAIVLGAGTGTVEADALRRNT
jgi:hypothetical protein